MQFRFFLASFCAGVWLCGRPALGATPEIETRTAPQPPVAEEKSPDSASSNSSSPPKKDESAEQNSEPAAGALERPVPLQVNVPPVELGPNQQVAADAPALEVVIELIINETGRVIASRILSGPEPYAAATLQASDSWIFEPARQSGQAVTAKIHFLVTFEPPRAPDEAQEDQTSSAPEEEPSPRTSAATAEVIQEVVVLGKYSNPTGTKITRMEARNLAGAFEDPLRAIEVMPGVTPIATGLPMFFVRGAPPANVGYFIDGIRVPLLYHAFLGPSVIHPAMIDKVALHAGPMPSEFGRYAGAAVEAELVGPPDRLQVEASQRLIDVGLFVQAPVANQKGYVQLGGRYSYTALLFSLFSPGTRLDYWDYQGRVGYRLGNQDEVSLMALGAYDYVGSDGEVIGGTEYHRIDARWDHDFSARDHLRIAGTWGRDRTRSDLGYLSDRLFGGRINYEHAAEKLLFRSGADVWVDSYTLDVDPSISEPEVYLELFPTRTDVQGGLWADVVLFPQGKVQVIPGVRADVYHSLADTRASVDPRIAAEYELTPKLRAVHSLGTAHQTPNFVPNIPGVSVAGLDGGLQKSLQAATKYEYDFPLDITASLGFFINQTRDLTDPIGLGQNFAIDETSRDARSLGRAYGMEVYIKRPLTRRLGFLLSYTYSTAWRSFGAVTTHPGYDRPHVLNAAVTYDIIWGIRASVKFALSSGILGRRIVQNNISSANYVFDQSRSFPFVRLDAKLEKRWVVSEHLNWGLHAEVLNATNTGNVTTRSCSPSGCTNSGTLPITFPSLGADIAWK